MIKYTKEILEEAIKDCTNWADVCRKIGIQSSTGGQSHLQKRAKFFEINTDHFLGKAHGKGKPSLFKKDALTYCFNGSLETSHKLKNKLIRDGYKKAKCEKCGYSHWMGYPLVLELDHIDGNHTNNEIENLQILCPNCHALKTKLSKSSCGQTGKVA